MRSADAISLWRTGPRARRDRGPFGRGRGVSSRRPCRSARLQRELQQLAHIAGEEARKYGEPADLAFELQQMAELFDRDKSVVSRHSSSAFESGELRRTAVVAESATTAAAAVARCARGSRNRRRPSRSRSPAGRAPTWHGDGSRASARGDDRPDLGWHGLPRSSESAARISPDLPRASVVSY